MQKVKHSVLALNFAVFFFSPGLVGYGRAPISFISSRRGLTLPLVPLLPWPFHNSKPAESSKIPWEGVGCGGCGNPEQPLQCSVGNCWWTAPQLMPPAQRACLGTEHPQGGGGGEDEQLRGPWGTAIFKTQLSGPQGGDQVLREWENYLRLV